MSIYSRRRKLIWQKLRNPKTAFAFWIATASGAGLFPIAPGTAGTVAALPVVYFTIGWPVESRLLFWVLMTFAGTWAAKVVDEAMETKDNQNIVIDEVIGFGIASWTIGPWLGVEKSTLSWVTAFLLFRFFDGVKPPPIRQVDRWSHSQPHSPWSGWLGGFGVNADDIVAGFQSLAIVMILQWLRVLG